MLRLVRSALRTADRFVQVPSSGVRLKQLGNLVLSNFKGGAPTAKSLSSSATIHIPPHAHRSPPIQSNFSLPVRTALNRPMGGLHLPRAPTVPRSVTQVGLGTARNFSSSRHVFSNIVDNVPISTRALWEAEWNLKQAKKQKRREMKKAQKENEATIADKLKPKTQIQTSVVSVVEADEASFSEYFAKPAARVEGVSTVMEIPLYPAHERMPLPSPVDPSNFMPLRDIGGIHEVHALHSKRVSTIFKRLDAADAWANGAECECYGTPFGGLVTLLRIAFTGWTLDMVKEALGEAGKGWCTFTEERAVEEAARTPTPLSPDPNPLALADSSMSFVIPTLDFSSSFVSHAEPHFFVAPTTQLGEHADWTPFSSRPTSPLLSLMSDSEDEAAGSRESMEIPVHQSLFFSTDFLHRGSSSQFDSHLSL